jgi:hypothetical protein
VRKIKIAHLGDAGGGILDSQSRHASFLGNRIGSKGALLLVGPRMHHLILVDQFSKAKGLLFGAGRSLRRITSRVVFSPRYFCSLICLTAIRSLADGLP